MRHPIRLLLIPAFLTAPLAGCGGGGGSTTDNAAPVGTPITAESAKESAKSINSNSGPMKPAGVPK